MDSFKNGSRVFTAFDNEGQLMLEDALGDWFTNRTPEEARRVVEHLSLTSGLVTLDLVWSGEQLDRSVLG